MTETILLSLVCLLLTVIVAVLAGSVPYLGWKVFKLEMKVEALDEVLAELLETAGLGAEAKADNGRVPGRTR